MAKRRGIVTCAEWTRDLDCEVAATPQGNETPEGEGDQHGKLMVSRRACKLHGQKSAEPFTRNFLLAAWPRNSKSALCQRNTPVIEDSASPSLNPYRHAFPLMHSMHLPPSSPVIFDAEILLEFWVSESSGAVAVQCFELDFHQGRVSDFQPTGEIEPVDQMAASWWHISLLMVGCFVWLAQRLLLGRLLSLSQPDWCWTEWMLRNWVNRYASDDNTFGRYFVHELSSTNIGIDLANWLCKDLTS